MFCFSCLFVCLFACLLVCLFACLFAFLMCFLASQHVLLPFGHHNPHYLCDCACSHRQRRHHHDKEPPRRSSKVCCAFFFLYTLPLFCCGAGDAQCHFELQLSPTLLPLRAVRLCFFGHTCSKHTFQQRPNCMLVLCDGCRRRRIGEEED